MLTIGQLKELISNYRDDMFIIVDAYEYGYDFLETVETKVVCPYAVKSKHGGELGDGNDSSRKVGEEFTALYIGNYS